MFGKQLLLIALIILSVIGQGRAENAAPAARCLSAFNPAFPSLTMVQMTRVRTEFKHDPDSYTKRLDPATPVRDQCSYGSCWVHASLKNFEYIARDKSGNLIPLSSDYLIAANLYNESLKILITDLRLGKAMPQYLKGRQTVSQGGFAHQAMTLVNKVGLVPDAVWKSRINFTKDAQLGDRMHFQINFLLQELKKEFRAVLKANRLKTKDIGEKEFSDFPEPVKTFLVESEQKIKSLIWSYTGDIPQKFSYHLNGETKEFTPATFREEVIKFNKVTNISPKGLDETEQVFKMIQAEIDQGRPVFLSIGWVKMFVDKKTGVMSINAFPSPIAEELKADPKRWQALAKSLHSSGRHAVTITGYEIDAAGKPVKLLIENSWGDDVGERGFYHMYWDYFSSFTPGIHVFR